MSDFISSLLARAARYRQYARSFPDERTRQALRVLAAKLEERARQMRLKRAPQPDGATQG